MALVLVVLALLVYFLPSAPVDPWNLVSPKNIAKMIFALSIIQAMGSIIGQLLGNKMGSILTGFLGGLVSSTATSASLARKSKIKGPAYDSTGIVIFLSATGAMLMEMIAIVFTGKKDIHFSLLLIFLGPVLVTIIAIIFQSKNLSERAPAEVAKFEILPILKLSTFILGILMLSKILQKFFGQTSLFVLTFLASLFEVHGSVIVNMQLHDSGVFTVQTLGGVLAISIMASYISKLFLIGTLGGRSLRNMVLKETSLLFLSLIVSLTAFYFLF